MSSVHSFAESNIGPAYLTYIVFLLLLTLFLLIFRGDKLQGAAKANVWSVSKESTLLYTNFFLIFLLAIVMFGTLWPIITEAVRGVKVSVQQPYFNAFAPWIGVALVALIGLGNLLKWRSGKIEDGFTCLLMPAVWAVILTGCLYYKKQFDVRSTVGFFLVIWSTLVLIMDLVYKLKALRFNGTLFLKFNRPYLGSLIVHIGFLLAVAGFLGGYRGLDVKSTLPLNGQTEFYGYTFTNDGLRYTQGSNVQNAIAKVRTTRTDGTSFYVEPMRSKYTTNADLMNEIGIHSTFWHDIYIVLANFDQKTQEVSLNIHINPTVKFVWTSLVVMVIGILVGLTHKVAPTQRRTSQNGLDLEMATHSVDDLVASGFAENFGWRKSGISTSIAIIGFVVSTTVFGFSGLALAQDAMQTPAQTNPVPAVQMNPLLKDVGADLRCPTCQGLSILDSETPQSIAMRAEVEKQLAEGRSKEQIIDFFKQRYGEWILREPDSKSGSGFFIWILPISGFFIGPAVLLYFLRRSRRKEQEDMSQLRSEIQNYIAQKRGGV